MKTKSLLSKLACTALCVSPFLISGCTPFGMSDSSPRYDGVNPQVHAHAHHRGDGYHRGDRYATTRNTTTVTTTKGVRTATGRMPSSSSAAVPVQSPTVQNSNHRRVRTTTTTSNAAIGNNNVGTSTAPSTGMVVPNVGQ